MQIRVDIRCRKCKGLTKVQIMGNVKMEFTCHLCGKYTAIYPSKISAYGSINNRANSPVIPSAISMPTVTS